MVANIKCEQLCVFFKKKRQNLAKIQALPGPAPGAGPGKPEQIPTPRPETPKSPEEPDPESPMCCYLLVFADDLLPDNVGVHIDNLLWVSQVCRHFSEVVFLVLLDGADDVKGF